MNLDASLTIWLNNLTSNPLIAWKVRAISEGGPVLVALVAIWYWWHPANKRMQFRLRQTVVLAVLAALLALIFKEALSLFYFRVRPYLALPELAGKNLLTDPSASFFSLHTAAGVAFAVAWWRRGFHKIGGWLLALALLMGLSRVMAGVHYPSDILGGILFGWLAAWVITRESVWLRKYLKTGGDRT